MIRLRLVLFVFFITFVSIVTGQKSATNISDKSDFDSFSGLPLTGKYGQVSALKIVLSLDNEQLYFINSNHFKYHHEFCAAQLSGTSDLSHFNELNYSNSKKRWKSLQTKQKTLSWARSRLIRCSTGLLGISLRVLAVQRSAQ